MTFAIPCLPIIVNVRQCVYQQHDETHFAVCLSICIPNLTEPTLLAHYGLVGKHPATLRNVAQLNKSQSTIWRNFTTIVTIEAYNKATCFSGKWCCLSSRWSTLWSTLASIDEELTPKYQYWQPLLSHFRLDRLGRPPWWRTLLLTTYLYHVNNAIVWNIPLERGPLSFHSTIFRFFIVAGISSRNELSLFSHAYFLFLVWDPCPVLDVWKSLSPSVHKKVMDKHKKRVSPPSSIFMLFPCLFRFVVCDDHIGFCKACLDQLLVCTERRWGGRVINLLGHTLANFTTFLARWRGPMLCLAWVMSLSAATIKM